MLGILPLIPLLYIVGGAILGIGGTVAVRSNNDKPPYKTEADAYKNYVKSVEECDWERYQWAVTEGKTQEFFTLDCDQRNKQNFAEITEGVTKTTQNQDKSWNYSGLSPWTRKQTPIKFKKWESLGKL